MFWKVFNTIKLTCFVLLVIRQTCAQSTETNDKPAFNETAELEKVSSILPQLALNWRLSNASYPLSYDIHINVNLHLNDLNYTGSSSILIQVQQTTDKLYLHAKNLSITAVTLKQLCDKAALQNADCEVMQTGQVSYLNESEMIALSFQQYNATFKSNSLYVMNIDYKGVIQDEAAFGFYVITELEADNEKIIGAMTQFQPTSARSFMPCYDEPGLKANFTLHVTHAPDYKVIANTQEAEDSSNNYSISSNYTTTHFKPTPPMSSYLLAFVIFQQDKFHDYSIANDNSGSIPQRVFVHHNMSESNVTTTISLAPLVLQKLSDYLEYPFALAKLDHFAVPEMFGTAMENWGLITYKQRFIYEGSPMRTWKLAQLSTMVHEMTHQWLGNLVSPEWWDQLWLSEGLGSYLSFLVLDMVQPDSKDMMMEDCPLNFLREDASGPIVGSGDSPVDFGKLFGSTVYKKAPCMLRMMHHALGDKIFRRGLSLYVKRHAYTAVSEQQYFDALQAAALATSPNQFGLLNLAKIFETWTHRHSYPSLTITRNYETNVLTIKQTALNTTEESNYWWIPLKFRTSHSPQPSVTIFMPPQAQWTVDLKALNLTSQKTATNDDWYIVSMQNTEIYRVNYDTRNIRRLAQALLSDHKQLNRYERASLLQHQANSFENFQAEEMLALLDLLKYLEKEEDIYVWLTAANMLGSIVGHFENRRSVVLMRLYFQKLSQPIMSIYERTEKADFKKPSNNSVMEEELIYSLNFYLGCFIERKACFVRAAARNAKEHELPDTQNTQLACTVGRNITIAQFNELLDEIMPLNRTKEYDPILIHALRCTPNATLYEKLLLRVIFHVHKCETLFEALNIIVKYLEFSRIQQTFVVLDQFIDGMLEDVGVCSQYELFLENLMPYCLKTEAYGLKHISSLCLQHTVGKPFDETYATLDYYDAEDQQLYTWLSTELENQLLFSNEITKE